MIRAVLIVSISTLLAACGGSGSSDPYSPKSNEDPPLLDVSPSGASSVNYNLWDQIDALPSEALSDAELEGLAFDSEIRSR